MSLLFDPADSHDQIKANLAYTQLRGAFLTALACLPAPYLERFDDDFQRALQTFVDGVRDADHQRQAQARKDEP